MLDTNSTVIRHSSLPVDGQTQVPYEFTHRPLVKRIPPGIDRSWSGFSSNSASAHWESHQQIGVESTNVVPKSTKLHRRATTTNSSAKIALHVMWQTWGKFGPVSTDVGDLGPTFGPKWSADRPDLERLPTCGMPGVCFQRFLRACFQPFLGGGFAELYMACRIVQESFWKLGGVHEAENCPLVVSRTNLDWVRWTDCDVAESPMLGIGRMCQGDLSTDCALASRSPAGRLSSVGRLAK